MPPTREWLEEAIHKAEGEIGAGSGSPEKDFPTLLQLNKIANRIVAESSAESRRAMQTAFECIWPKAVTLLNQVLQEHPVNANWEEFVDSPLDKRYEYFLPEESEKPAPDKVGTPGQIAYEAYCQTTDWKSLITGAPLPQWPEVKPEIKAAWENAAAAARKPVAVKLYEARHAITRLLVTYRTELKGTWYEDTVKSCGMELDEIGFIKGPYKDDLTGVFGERGRMLVNKIARGEAT